VSRAPAARLELTPAWLAEHVVQRRTAQQIADASGWSSQYVRDRLREFGIGLRPTGVHGGLSDAHPTRPTSRRRPARHEAPPVPRGVRKREVSEDARRMRIRGWCRIAMACDDLRETDSTWGIYG
jgi:hypothetical protein